MTQEKKVQTAAVMDVTGVERSAQDAVRAVKSMAEGIAREGELAGKGIEAMGGGFDRAEKIADAATKSISDRLRRLTRDAQRDLAGLAASSDGGRGSASALEYEASLRGANTAKLQKQIDAYRDLKAQVDALNASMRQAVANDAFLEGINSRTAALQHQAAAVGMTEADLLALKAAEMGVAQQAEPMIAKLRAAAAAADEVSAASKRAASGDKFLSGLSSQAGAIGKTRADLLELQAAELGVIEKARPMIQAIRDADNKLYGIGATSKATAAAMRGVPAQFTDIVVSLQAGQNPLQVFLQQGGQLKDMFGGIGPAAKALGGYVLGLINPFTLAAAAAGALAFAYNQGANEAQAFQKSLILNGQAAGVTAGQLSDMARAVKESGAGTQGRAAEILNAMAGSAKVGAENMGRFTAAALRLEAVGGPAAEETAKAFADLAKDPLQAALKLNEGTNFLTTSVYKQIKALDEQGRTVEAAKVAQVAYFEAVNGMTPALLQNLGYVERAWLGIKEAAKLAFDAVASVGRDMGPDAQAKALRNRIASVEAGNEGQSGRALLPELRASLELLAKANFLESERAAAIGDQAQARKDFVKWTEDGGKLLDKEDQKRKELIRVETEGRRLIIKGLITEQELRDRLAATRAKYADKSPGAKPLVNPLDVESMRAYAKTIDDFGRIAVQASAKADGLSKTQERLREIQGDPAWQTYSRQQQEQIIFSAALSQAEETRAAITERAAKATAEAAKESARWMDELRKGADTIEQQADKLRVEAEASLLVVDGYRSLEQAIHLVEIARLRERQAKLQDGEDAAVLAIQREIDARQQLIDQIGQRDRRKAAEDDAKKTAADWKKTAEQINDTLTDALLRGFESGKGFARNLRDTVVNMFKTMVLRPVVSAIISPVAQAITGSLGLSGLANAAGSAAGGFNALGAVGGIAGIGASLGAFGTAAGYGASALFGGTGLTALSGGASMVGAGSIASGLGMITGVLGPIALGLGVVANLLKDKSATLGYSGGSFNAEGAYAQATGTRLMVFGDGNDQFNAGLQKVTDSFSSTLADTAKAFGGQVAGLQVFIGNDVDRKGLGSGSIQFLRDGTRLAGVQTGGTDPRTTFATKIDANNLGAFFSDAASAALVAGLQQSDLPARFKDYFASFDAFSLSKDQADKVLATASAVQALTDNVSGLGGAMTQLAGLSVSAIDGIAQRFGGLDAFSGSLTSYYQAFYSDAERSALSRQQLTKQLAGLGLGLPATTEGYRALVDAQDLSTEAGRNTYAALIKLNGAFAELTKTTAGTGDAIQAEIDRLRGLGSTKQDKAGLLASFATNTAQARAGDAAALQALPSISKALEEAAAATAGSALDIARMREWLASSLTDTLKGVPGFAAGGDFGGGLRLVGEKGPELQVTGPARIYSAADTARMLRGGSSETSEALLAEIAERLARLEDSNRATAMHSSKTARLIERAMPDGDALATRTAAP